MVQNMALKTTIRNYLCPCQNASIVHQIGRNARIKSRQLHVSKWKWNRFSRTPKPVENGGYKGRIFRPFMFTVTVGATSFAGASILQYEKLRYDLEHGNSYRSWFPENHFGKEIKWRDKVNKWWNRLATGHKVVAGIIALNVGVFLCWRIPSCSYFLTKWFTANPSTKRTLPMLLSCFSHAELWHLGCNMVVLWSFAPVIVDILGAEQFLAFYTTGGVIASLASHFYKTILRTPSLSLGASGAILAVLAAVCVERPEARLSIIFLPFFSFPASTALLGIIALDFTGLVLRWQLFDHAAHLGGALFGIWYSKYGQETIWQKRTPLMRWWHSLRKGKD